MEQRRDSRKLWWFAGGVAAGVAGYLAIRYPLESATAVGRGVLMLQGASVRETAWPGGTIRYFMLGRGKQPLVLVHGIGDSPESYGLLTQRLLRDFRICIPIMPGHPGSAAPSDLQIGHMVQALDAVILREFGAQKVHLFGNSLGGWVAALFAAAASERLASLMLVNPAGKHGVFRRDVLVPATDDEAGAALRALFGRNADRAPRFLRQAYARSMQNRSEPAVSRMMEDAPRLGEQLTRISARTMVVIGDRDRIVPPQQSQQIADAIRYARVEVIPGGSHVPHLTHSAALHALVNRHTTEPHLLEA